MSAVPFDKNVAISLIYSFISKDARRNFLLDCVNRWTAFATSIEQNAVITQTCKDWPVTKNSLIFVHDGGGVLFSPSDAENCVAKIAAQHLLWILNYWTCQQKVCNKENHFHLSGLLSLDKKMKLLPANLPH